MKRTITETQLRNIIRESLRLLTESDSRLKQVDAIIDREFKGLLDPDMRVTSAEYYVNHNENTTWRDYLMYSLRHTFSLMRNSDVKYLPFVAKIAFSDEVGFEKRNDNATQINNLREVVELMKQDQTVFEKLKATCNTYADVMKLCKPYIEAKKNEMNTTVDTTDYGGNKGYEIVWVKDFEMANRYGNQSCPTSKLCYTQGKSTWENYTDKGKNKVYVCLKQGWKNMKPTPGADAPYDDYGTSMIFVFINPDGEIAYANTRWNHENAGNTNVDHSFDKHTLSEVLGVNVNDVLKPYSKEELKAMGIVLSDMLGTIYTHTDGRTGIVIDVDENDTPTLLLALRNTMGEKVNKAGKRVGPSWYDAVGDFDNPKNPNGDLYKGELVFEKGFSLPTKEQFDRIARNFKQIKPRWDKLAKEGKCDRFTTEDGEYSVWFWSSTERSESIAYGFNTVYGNVYYYLKNYTNFNTRVRGVSAL